MRILLADLFDPLSIFPNDKNKLRSFSTSERIARTTVAIRIVYKQWGSEESSMVKAMYL